MVPKALAMYLLSPLSIASARSSICDSFVSRKSAGSKGVVLSFIVASSVRLKTAVAA
jgi:hypothetical protein